MASCRGERSSRKCRCAPSATGALGEVPRGSLDACRAPLFLFLVLRLCSSSSFPPPPPPPPFVPSPPCARTRGGGARAGRMRGTARFSSTSRSTGQTGTQSRTSPRALWTFTTALLRPPSHWPAESFEMESPSALLSHDNPGHQSWSLCVGAVPQLEAWQGNTNRRFCLAFNAWLWQGASPHLSSFPLAHFSSARLGESAGQSTRLGPIPGLREREREAFFFPLRPGPLSLPRHQHRCATNQPTDYKSGRGP